MSTNYKVGDWVFCEFKLQLIKEVKDGHVSEVCDGWVSLGSKSLNDRCFPLELSVLCISDSFSDRYTKILREGAIALNIPDIHRWLVNKWCEACNARNNERAVQDIIREMDSWSNEILRRCADLKNATVGGVKLFR